MPQPGRTCIAHNVRGVAPLLALLMAAIPQVCLARIESDAAASLLQGASDEAYRDTAQLFQAQTVPPSFWMWRTTPAPPMPPQPNPQVMWVEQTAPPLPTTPPIYDQCYGCDCLVAFPGGFLSGGDISSKYTCHSGGPTPSVPEFRWAGAPVNSGVGHELTQVDGTSCTKSQSFAITMEDLDYPNGVGETTNQVYNVFWAVNIPGDWTELTEANAFQTYKEMPIVTIGKTAGGHMGLEAPCPTKGVHRFRISLYALKSYMGSEIDPVDPTSNFESVILPFLETNELSKSVFYGNVKAPGYTPALFLQRATSWLRGSGPKTEGLEG